MAGSGNPSPATACAERRRSALLALVNRHCEAEAAQDLDAVLATVGPSPHFEIHPLGLILSTTDAVAAFYERMLPMFAKYEPKEAESATFDGGDSGRFIGQAGVVTRDHVTIRTAAGEDISIRSLALFELDDDSGLLRGEQIFLNHHAAGLFSSILGGDFLKVPGVSRSPSATWPAGFDVKENT